MTVLITTEGLAFNYEAPSGTVNALGEIDLKVYKGEHIAVIGPNGSGKSTLIKHFNALLTPTRGEVRVGDFSTRDTAHINQIRQICGMVLQNPDNQIVATTVEEDVAFGPENLGLSSPEIKRRVNEATKIAGIAHLTSSAPHLLSGGQKQRVAIAGILAMQPECLLLDEPTSLLDPQGQEEITELIHKLNKEDGKTIIHVTHSMDEAARAARILVMYDGRIVCDDSAAAILSKVDKLKGWDLEPPVASLLAEKLRLAGINLPPGVIHMEKLVESLCS